MRRYRRSERYGIDKSPSESSLRPTGRHGHKALRRPRAASWSGRDQCKLRRGIDRAFSGSEQLNAYQITRLRISARADLTTTAGLSLDSGPFGTVDFSMTAPSDEMILGVRQEMSALIREARPWYSRLSTLDFVGVALFLLAAGWVAAVFGVALGFISIKSTGPSDSASEARSGAKFYDPGHCWSVCLGLESDATRPVSYSGLRTWRGCRTLPDDGHHQVGGGRGPFGVNRRLLACWRRSTITANTGAAPVGRDETDWRPQASADRWSDRKHGR